MPEKPESTIIKAAETIITPKEATFTIMLMALFPLFENKYLLAINDT
jgi:hypothetical protein